jgi:hypothetical protein
MTITGSEKQDSPTTSVPARKRTPTGSKTWKEKLRLACIDRARQRRRHDHANDGNDHERNNDSDKRPNDEFDGDSSMSILPPARAILEEELRQQGITIMSPCINMDNRNDQQQSPSRDASSSSSRYSQVDSPSAAAFTANNDSGINVHTSGDNKKDDNAIHANHYISEEELFELLQEVEEEMQRSEEEMHQLLAREREHELEQQVQDFEEQQEQDAATIDSSLWNTTVPIAVLCPICKEANLSETRQGVILCPNHMDGSCPFELRAGNGDARQHGLTLTLENLCQQLRYAYEQHALYCHNYLSFEVHDNTMIHEEHQQQQQEGQAENTSLVAVCPACETRMQLV